MKCAVGQEVEGGALSAEKWLPTDGNAAGLSADVRIIYADDPPIEAIEGMADARE